MAAASAGGGLVRVAAVVHLLRCCEVRQLAPRRRRRKARHAGGSSERASELHTKGSGSGFLRRALTAGARGPLRRSRARWRHGWAAPSLRSGEQQELWLMESDKLPTSSEPAADKDSDW